MKKLLYICLFLVSFCSANGQLSGTVKDSSGQGVSKATVSAIKGNNTAALTVLTDTTGYFHMVGLPAGKYRVRITSAGYQDTYTELLEVLEGEDKHLVRNIRLKSDVKTLAGAVVTATRSLYTMTDEKVVYNYSADSTVKGLNLLDGIRNVPFISVDEQGVIRYRNGIESILVILNGRKSFISRNPTEVLRGFPSTVVKNVELILTPSAKYKAEGYGAVLNITTTTNDLNGTIYSLNTSVNSRYGFGTNHYVMSKKGKFNLSMSVFNSRDKNRISSVTSKGINNTDSLLFNQQASYRQQDDIYNANAEIGYEIDSFSLLSLYFSYNGLDMRKPGNILAEQMSGQSVLNSRSLSVQLDNTNNKYETGLNYQRLYRKPGKEFSVAFRYSDNRMNNRVTQFSQKGEMEKNNNAATTKEAVWQMDYNTPLSKQVKIENTVHSVYRQLQSGYSLVFQPDSGAVQNAFTTEGNFSYKQFLASMYNNLNISFSSSRIILGNSTIFNSEKVLSMGSSTNKPVLEVTPFIQFATSLPKNRVFRTKYSYKIKRPGINYLNTYEDKSDPSNVVKGNAGLKKEGNHLLEFSYQTFYKKRALTFTLYNSYSNNTIQRLTDIVPGTGISYSSYYNLGSSVYSLLYTTYGFRYKNIFRLNTSFGLGYQYLKSTTPAYSINGIYYTLSSNFMAAVCKNVTVQANVFINSKTYYLQGKSTGTQMMTFGLNKSLENKKGSFSLSISDPFLKRRAYSSTVFDSRFYSENLVYKQARTLNLSFYYQFGKLQSGSRLSRKRISIDDQKALPD